MGKLLSRKSGKKGLIKSKGSEGNFFPSSITIYTRNSSVVPVK